MKAGSSGSGPCWASGGLERSRLRRRRSARTCARRAGAADDRRERPGGVHVPIAGRVGRHDAELAGHLDLDDEGAPIEVEDQPLAAPADGHDRAPWQRRHVTGQIGMTDRGGPVGPGLGDGRPDDERCQLARHRLDLGQLGHRRSAGSRQGAHRLPVVTDLDVDVERARRAASRLPSSRARARPSPRPRRAAPRGAARRGPGG